MIYLVASIIFLTTITLFPLIRALKEGLHTLDEFVSVVCLLLAVGGWYSLISWIRMVL
jgi:hypothetical protein